MKLVCTICDFAAAKFVAGDVKRDSYIIEIPDENIPGAVKRTIEELDSHRDKSMNDKTFNYDFYETIGLSFTILRESKE